MAEITHEEMSEIKRRVEEEFPDDPALQQVHVARKVLAREAEHERVELCAVHQVAQRRWTRRIQGKSSLRPFERCGYFPSHLRLRPVGGNVPTGFEVAEVLNLQAVRDRARAGRK